SESFLVGATRAWGRHLGFHVPTADLDFFHLAPFQLPMWGLHLLSFIGPLDLSILSGRQCPKKLDVYSATVALTRSVG
ncbi:hypothetical protein LB507_003732, partial [Fusarium sp. FIESC RH6]